MIFTPHLLVTYFSSQQRWILADGSWKAAYTTLGLGTTWCFMFPWSNFSDPRPLLSGDSPRNGDPLTGLTSNGSDGWTVHPPHHAPSSPCNLFLGDDMMFWRKQKKNKITIPQSQGVDRSWCVLSTVIILCLMHTSWNGFSSCHWFMRFCGPKSIKIPRSQVTSR